MLSKTLLDEMNLQIMHELYSAYLYLSMSAHFEASNLPGFAHWMRLQSNEEVEHAMKFFGFINDRGERVVLLAIEKPPAEFKSATTIFEMGLEHEKKVTGRINHIYNLAAQEKDFASQEFLNWFVNEQVEEEKNASQIVAALQMAGENGPSLLMLDGKLGEREAE
ncbi:MAG: ferritin [Anaerolineaceae bacterium]|nr:ferritin [Anaerolineaceae bacterium]